MFSILEVVIAIVVVAVVAWHIPEPSWAKKLWAKITGKVDPAPTPAPAPAVKPTVPPAKQ